MHEDARELLTLLVLLGDHVHALHESKLERVHDGADALLRDVLEDPRDADAVDDGLGLALGTVATGALLVAVDTVALRPTHIHLRREVAVAAEGFGGAGTNRGGRAELLGNVLGLMSVDRDAAPDGLNERWGAVRRRHV